MNNQENKARNNSARANNVVDIESLVTGLKKEDERNLKMTRNFRRLLVIMAIFYTLLLVVNPDQELMMHHRISGLFYVTAFALFAVVYTRLYHEYRGVDYSLTTADMLQQAARRYRFGTWRYIWMLPSLILLDAGLTISFYQRWISVEPLNRVLIVQAFFIPLMALSAFIGYLIWRRKQKPLHDSALKLLDELQ